MSLTQLFKTLWVKRGVWKTGLTNKIVKMIKLKIEEQYARLKSAGLIKESTKTSDENQNQKLMTK
jgi:hypothetical protein